MFKKGEGRGVCRITRGGGILILLGAPFLFGGMLSMLTAYNIVQSDFNGQRFALLGVGLVFTAIGFLLIFGRSGLVVNRDNKKVTRWYGLVVPMKKNEYPLDSFCEVRIDRDAKRSEGSTTTVYPVFLAGAGDLKDILIEEHIIYDASRDRAEEMARAAGLPLVDTTSGTRVVRAADRWSEPVRVAYMRGRRRTALEKPLVIRTDVKEEAGKVTVDVPPRGLNVHSVMWTLMGLVWPVAFGYFFIYRYLEKDMSLVDKIFIFGFMGVFFIAVPFATGVWKLLDGLMRREVVTVTHEFLRVETLGILTARIEEIPSGRLEELLVTTDKVHPASGPSAGKDEEAGSAVIVARSNENTITFCEGLREDEVRYIHSLIEKVIAFEPPEPRALAG